MRSSDSTHAFGELCLFGDRRFLVCGLWIEGGRYGFGGFNLCSMGDARWDLETRMDRCVKLLLKTCGVSDTFDIKSTQTCLKRCRIVRPSPKTSSTLDLASYHIHYFHCF